MTKVRPENSQREHLFHLVESKFYSSNEVLDIQTKKVMWENITRILNSMGPPKSCSKWRKFWSDVLLRVRKKIVFRNTNEDRDLKKAEYTKEDLEVLRITGGEQKLLRGFKPRNFTKITNKGIPTYYINESSIDVSEFEVTNQPVSDDYCQMEQIQSGNSYDHTMDDDSIQVETDFELNEKKIQSTKATHNEQKNNSHRPNINIPKNSNQNSSKRRNISHQFDSSSNSSSNSKYLPMIEQQQNDEEYITNFDINEENASYNLNNAKRFCTEKINFAPLMPIKQNQETAKYKRQPQQQQQQQQQQQHQQQLQQHQQQQEQFSPNQFGYYNEELLNVQKETLMEIRKVNERQQETNQLLKILIEKLGNSADASTNKHNEEAELKQISKNILCETYFKDASEIVIKNEC